MSKTRYSAPVGAAVALVAATAKSILSVTAPAQFGVDWVGYSIGFDGVTAANTPVVVELCYCTFAGAGTTTAGTVGQTAGRSITPGFTTAYNYTVEPTVVTPFERFTMTPNGGTIIRDFQGPNTPDSAISQGFLIRCTAPQGVNVNGTMFVERC